jgi:hemin uptake protein HemP
MHVTDKDDPHSLTAGDESRPKTISSADLLGGQDEVMIQHNGSTYRLRITRQDKLILTK